MLHGINAETGGACAAEWEAKRGEVLTLGETFDLLRSFHRKSPFLFSNGNTFADIDRQLAFALFSDLPVARKREVSSSSAHCIGGVLDREAMVEIVDSRCKSGDLIPGDFVKTLRGSAQGKVLGLLPDGRVEWQPAGSASEIIALPESLIRVNSASPNE